MKILITGGAGFVGSNLALALREQMPDAAVTCLDNLYRNGSQLNVPRLEAAGIRFHRGDVRDPATFPVEPFDLMIECSAEPSVLAGQDGSPDYLFQTNLVGSYHCLEACRRHGAGIIFLSTSRIYPIARLEEHPWREEETRFVWADEGTLGITSRGVTESVAIDGPRSLYGFTKLAAEQLIDEYRATYGLKAVVNRCGVIAGPWQFGKVDQGVVSLWVMAHHFKRRLSYIGYGGTGKQVRDMLHIDDLCDHIVGQVRHFDAWDGWLGNVAGGLECSASLQELTAFCREITGNTIEIASIPENRPNDLRIFLADCSKLFARSPWRPKRTVCDIVADTHAWVREHEATLEGLSMSITRDAKACAFTGAAPSRARSSTLES
jgi:CDP-paratose 2-epimerase